MIDIQALVNGIEIDGRTFELSFAGNYLTEGHHNISSVEEFFNEKMGFDCKDKRNEYIKEATDIYCQGCSPQFSTVGDLITFLNWFIKENFPKRIILTKNQIKNSSWKL
jgi:hypothetical protein